MKDYTTHEVHEAHTRRNIVLMSIIGLVCAGGAAFGVAALFMGAEWFGIGDEPPVNNGSACSAPEGDEPAGPAIEIGIAYGTEKEYWLKDAVREWEKTPGAAQAKIKLIPMGSIEGAQAALAGDEKIHVWSPASAIYKDKFLADWRIKYGNDGIVAEENLALSPMVFVMWEERYDAFVAKYCEISFNTLEQALNEPTGWDAIAGKPDWGLFKFGHTHPNKSNSGLVSLFIMAYDYHKKTRGLAMKDILDTGFQGWFEKLESGTDFNVHSTGTLMRNMVQKGPSTFDCVMVYENVALEHVKNAEGTWGSIRVVYPERNVWNENPYYILNADWSDDAHRKAARTFLDFLMTERIQRMALTHGFRPGNVRVPVRYAGSPLVEQESYGFKIELTTACEPPRAEVLTNILEIWQRRHGR
jgi:ABC-type Fe3+ transport system substrate-binding protein